MTTIQLARLTTVSLSLIVSFSFAQSNSLLTTITSNAWKIDKIIGIDSNNVQEYSLDKIDTTLRWNWGNKIKFSSDSTFSCNYSARCGNDCFPSSNGVYRVMDSSRIQLILKKVRQKGDCEHFDKSLNKTLGIYSIDKKDSTSFKLVREKTATTNHTASEKPVINCIKNDLPKGFVEFERIQGDLNNDNIVDSIIIIKGTDSSKFVTDSFDKLADRNRRGVLVYLSHKEQHYLACKNTNCFTSEQEDGGVYFSPELMIQVSNSKLDIEYSHGRYGSWSFKFELRGDDFILTHFYSSDDRGPIVNRQTRINFLTGKKSVLINVNENCEESGDEIFEETITSISNPTTYKLSSIKDFDKLLIKFDL